MDANEVIEGIEHFFRVILPKAYSSAEWDEESITNGFHWAEFCEQIYRNYKDSPSKNKLDDLIHSLGLNFKDVNQALCFEDLKNSTKELYWAFLQNHSVNDKVIESVLTQTTSDKSSSKDVTEKWTLDSMCIELLEALKPIKIVNSEKSFYYEVKAKIYLNVLKDAIQHMTTEDQVEKYLSNSLEKLSETTEQMMIFFHILIIKLPEETSSVKEIQEFAINWIMYKIMSEEDCDLVQFMLKQPPKLRAVSLVSTDFLNFYLDFLEKCSSGLKCELENNETVWIPSITGTKSLLFNEILIHFRSLLGIDDDICESAKQRLLDLLNSQREMLIWKEIFSRVT